MNIKKIILISLLIWIVTTAIGWLTCGWLFNWVYVIPPNIWLAPEAMLNVGNMIGSNLVGILSALIFTSVYALVYNGIQGEGAQKGMRYGVYVWLLGTLSGLASLPFYMTIATTVIIYWIIQGLVINLINGAIIGKMYKQ